MLVHNKQVLARFPIFYSHPLLRCWGLRFSSKLGKGEALVLVSPREGIYSTSIDMLFVFFPIDVLWLNSEHKIVDFRTNVKPFTLLVRPRAPAKFVVELPAGSLTKVVLGEKVSLD